MARVARGHPLARQAQAQKRASVNRLVAQAEAQIRAAFADARGQVAPTLAGFAHAYAAELARVNAELDDDEAPVRVPQHWLLTSGWGRRVRDALAHADRHASERSLAAVQSGRGQAVRLGDADATALVERAVAPLLQQLRMRYAQISGDLSGSGALWNYVPSSALQALHDNVFGRTVSTILNGDNAGNGQPLRALFSSELTGADMTRGTAFVLNLGLANGQNPAALQNQLADLLTTSQSRGLTIARTEMLGAYRDAQLENYRANSDVVSQWMWSADLGGACLMCTTMDGQLFPIDADMDSHVNCACSPVPVTKGWDEILGPLGISSEGLDDTRISADYETGVDWLMQQPDYVQRAVMGPAKWGAWRSGDATLEDFVGRRNDGAWGQPYYERSLKELGLNARDYLGKNAPEVNAEVPPVEKAPVALGASRAAEDTARFAKLYAAGAEEANFSDRAIARIAGNLQGDPEWQKVVGAFTTDMDRKLMAELGPEVVGSFDQGAVYRIINEYHHYRAGSSSGSPLQVALQEAARREFGLTKAAAAYGAAARDAALAQYGDIMPGLQKMLGEMYQQTQDYFREHDIAELTLYRGVRDAAADGLHPFSSFTLDPKQAEEFAGAGGKVIEMRVPAEQVLSTGLTGFGAPYMGEVLVLQDTPGEAGALAEAGKAFAPPPALATINMRSATGVTADTLRSAIDNGALARFGQSSNETYTATIDGRDYFVKKVIDRKAPGEAWRQVEAEVTADKMMQAAGLGEYGLPIQHIELDGQAYLVQPWQAGAKALAEQGDLHTALRAHIPVEDLQRLSLFNYAIGDADRNAGNYLQLADGRWVAIDRGYAFSTNTETPFESLYAGLNPRYFGNMYMSPKVLVSNEALTDLLGHRAALLDLAQGLDDARRAALAARFDILQRFLDDGGGTFADLDTFAEESQ